MKIANYQIESYIKNIDKQKIAGCLIFGPELSLVEFYSKEVAKKIVSDISDPFLVANISKDNLIKNSSIIADEFFSFSMLGGRKLIWINDSSANVTESIKSLILDNNFAQKSDNFILIQAGDLEKSNNLRKICETNVNFASLSCYEENEVSIKKFIAEELKTKKIKFDTNILELLYEKLDKKRDIIRLEIAKIDLFLDDDKNLTLEDAETLTVNQSELSINELVNNFANSKFGKSLIQARKLINEDTNPITIIRFLTNYFTKLYNAKNDVEKCNLDYETATKKQKLFFKIEAEFKKQIQNMSLNQIMSILKSLQISELEIKQGKENADFIFYKFLQQNRNQKISAK